MIRLLRIALFAAPLSLFACEASEDPFVGSEGGDRDTSVRDTGVSDVGADSGDTGSGDTGSGDTGSGDTGSGDTGSGDTGGSTCPDDVVFTGQVFVSDSPDPLSPDGGAPRFEPWDASYDAGIAALVAAAPASGDPVSGSWTITEATVIATDYNTERTQRAQRSFWLGDGNAAIQVFFFAEDEASRPTFSVKVGQRVSGTVTSLGAYQGMAQVSSADGASWALASEGNEVYIRDVDGPLSAADAHHVVRVTGTLASLDNPDCGGAKCYTLAYGQGQTVTLRTSSDFTSVGQCVTFVGPVRMFSGQPQLDSQNFRWLWTYDD